LQPALLGLQPRSLRLKEFRAGEHAYVEPKRGQTLRLARLKQARGVGGQLLPKALVVEPCGLNLGQCARQCLAQLQRGQLQLGTGTVPLKV
jgi:hypothetical protein